MKIRVELRERDSVESALRRLRRLCTNEGVRRGKRARLFFEKPSERRRRKERERLSTIRKAERERVVS